MSYHENLPVIEVGSGAAPRSHGFLWLLLTFLLVSLAVSAWVVRFSALDHGETYGEVSNVPPSEAEKERMLESLSEEASQVGEGERLEALESLAAGNEGAAPALSHEEMQSSLREALGADGEE